MANQFEQVMYLVFRADLKMPVGKVAAQAGHAVQGIIAKILTDMEVMLWDSELEKYRELCGRMQYWYKSSTKVALQVPDLDAFDSLTAQLFDHEIRHYVVTDEGRTCVEPNTRTCLAVEPMTRQDAAQLLGNLKLLR